MRILIHDYAGHPFQVELSRELARRGWQVMHVYSASTLTPHGDLTRRKSDPLTFDVRPITLSRTIRKYRFFERLWLESAYAQKLVEFCGTFQPDVVLSANSPSIVQHKLSRHCRGQGVRLVSWVQDLYGMAAYKILKRRIPIIGHLVGQYFMWLDRRVLRRSDAVVVISEDFEKLLAGWGVDARRLSTIHNWAPLEDLPLQSRDNAWSARQGLGQKLRYLYSGTLSVRHNPQLLLDLAKRFETLGEAELIVISQGSGVDWLRARIDAEDITTLRLLEFQPFHEMAQVFASADVLLAILEPDAGIFCVPSKVLSYMCAGRPLLAAIPGANLAARLVDRSSAGLVVEPTQSRQFVEAAERLYRDPLLREELGSGARLYAETHFDREVICDA
jgi:glycosyltransferase involved in cell wall biosynthesis